MSKSAVRSLTRLRASAVERSARFAFSRCSCLSCPSSEIFAIDEISAIAKQAAATRYAGHAVACFTATIFPGSLRGPSPGRVVPQAPWSRSSNCVRKISGLSGLRWRAWSAGAPIEYVRSYLGEALTDMAARMRLARRSSASVVDDLLLRVGFADPSAFATHDGGKARLRRKRGRRRRRGDGRARRSRRVARCGIGGGYLDEVTAALDARDDGYARGRYSR